MMELSKEQVLQVADDEYVKAFGGPILAPTEADVNFIENFGRAIARLATETQAEKLRELAGALQLALDELREMKRSVGYRAYTLEVIDKLEQTLATPQATIDAQDAAWWQPIETAPKDGTRVLLFWPAGTLYSDEHMDFGKWDSNRYSKTPRPYWEGSRTNNITEYRANPPTHWMPPPAAPAMQKGAGDE